MREMGNENNGQNEQYFTLEDVKSIMVVSCRDKPVSAPRGGTESLLLGSLPYIQETTPGPTTICCRGSATFVHLEYLDNGVGFLPGASVARKAHRLVAGNGGHSETTLPTTLKTD